MLVCLVCLVRLVCLVCLVRLVHLVRLICVYDRCMSGPVLNTLSFVSPTNYKPITTPTNVNIKSWQQQPFIRKDKREEDTRNLSKKTHRTDSPPAFAEALLLSPN